MSEIRIKQRPFYIGSSIILLLLFYLMLRSCEQSVEHEAQAVESKENVALPFIVYAITPTYARPVQKAELTR